MLLGVVDVYDPKERAVIREGKVRTFVSPSVRTERAGNVKIGVGGIVIVPSHDAS